jgi:hypothetical protein
MAMILEQLLYTITVITIKKHLNMRYMKIKFVLVFCISILFFEAFTQSLQIYYAGEILNNEDEITLSTTPNAVVTIDDLDVMNKSSNTLVVVCVREILENTNGALTSFGWGGQNNPADVDTSLATTTIKPKAVSGLFISDYFIPQEFEGKTKVKYTFCAQDNLADNVSVYVNLSPSVLATDEDKSALFNISKAYPNPANLFVSIDYHKNELDNASIAFYNLLGKEVKEVKLENLQGTITINTSDFIEGIYFYSLKINDEVTQTQKLIVKH